MAERMKLSHARPKEGSRTGGMKLLHAIGWLMMSCD